MFSAPRPEHAITAAAFRHHQQGLDPGLRMVALGFVARQGVNVFASVEQGHELATDRERDWILERSLPAALRHAVIAQPDRCMQACT